MDSGHDTTTSSCGSSESINQTTQENSKSLSLMESSGIFCRICHEGEGNEELIRPCQCAGSLQYVHHSCLLNWISRCGDLDCEICRYRYKIVRVAKQRVLEWKFPSVGVKGWLHIILFLAFLAMFLTSVIWIIWSQTSSSSSALVERTSPEIKYAYILNGIFILTALVGILVDSVRQFRRYFQRLLALNQEYVVSEYLPFNGAHKYTNQSILNKNSFNAHEQGPLLESENGLINRESICTGVNLNIETCL